MTNDTRAIFLDIDGTLIPFGAEAPCEQDRTALLRARAAGHKVLINTGRSSGFLHRDSTERVSGVQERRIYQ